MNLSEKQQRLAALPKPRNVRLSRRGRSWLRMLAGVGIVVEAGIVALLVAHRAGISTGAAASDGGLILAALLLPMLPLVLSRGWFKQKHLVEHGAVAIATITTTSNSPGTVNRNDDIRMVQYRFRSESDAVVTGCATDSTLLLRDGSAMLVYYDPANTADQVPQCASYYEVVAPGIEPDWMDQVG